MDIFTLWRKNTRRSKQTEKIVENPPNFLELVPVRAMKHIKKDWQVGFEVPRFKSKFWRRFFSLIGATENYVVRLDRMGSEIWEYIDGEKPVREILALLELHHPREKDLRGRLLHYLKRLEFHGFITLEDRNNQNQ